MKEKVSHTTSTIGLFLSIACAIHCVITPILLVSYPILNDTMLHNPVLEWTALGLLVLLGLFTMDHYKRKHHNNSLPSRIFILGALLCISALIVPSHFHEAVTIAGALVIGLSHGVNLKLGKVAA